MTRPPPSSTLFPYTTLFRSILLVGEAIVVRARDDRDEILPERRPAAGLRLERLHADRPRAVVLARSDRKSTRLNSSHMSISYAVFCLKKKKKKKNKQTQTHS